jgi:hypothetical protein
MSVTVRHFSRVSAQRDGAKYYYDGRKNAPRCMTCGEVPVRIAETDECLGCSSGRLVSLRSVTVGRDGRGARYSFFVRKGRAKVRA